MPQPQPCYTDRHELCCCTYPLAHRLCLLCLLLLQSVARTSSTLQARVMPSPASPAMTTLCPLAAPRLAASAPPLLPTLAPPTTAAAVSPVSRPPSFACFFAACHLHVIRVLEQCIQNGTEALPPSAACAEGYAEGEDGACSGESPHPPGLRMRCRHVPALQTAATGCT
jgi:hypothetical protein